MRRKRTLALAIFLCLVCTGCASMSQGEKAFVGGMFMAGLSIALFNEGKVDFCGGGSAGRTRFQPQMRLLANRVAVASSVKATSQRRKQMANFKTLIALAVSVLIPFGAYAAEDDDSETACPNVAAGKVHYAMENFVTWQRLSANRINNSPSTSQHLRASISLKNAIDPNWTCYTWEVELVLPHCFAVHNHTSTEVRSTAKVGPLQRTDYAYWVVDALEADGDNSSYICGVTSQVHQTHVGAYKVSVINSRNGAKVTNADGGLHWTFPLELIVDRR